MFYINLLYLIDFDIFTVSHELRKEPEINQHLILKTIKKVLLLKPPRTRSRTDMSCSEANAPQGPDEIAEPEAEVISKEVSETRSLGSDSFICVNIFNSFIIILKSH